ncbi:tyrosine aminotransferase, putative, partial [Perkinsus marinus ATCC 50983]
AIDMAIAVLANTNGEDTILLPQPSFPLYNTLCSSRGINVDFYKLRSDRKFEVDMTSLQRSLESNKLNAKGILLNNPSNPCGSNWTREHIGDIVALCQEFGNLPIIADEIYHDMVIR